MIKKVNRNLSHIIINNDGFIIGGTIISSFNNTHMFIVLLTADDNKITSGRTSN